MFRRRPILTAFVVAGFAWAGAVANYLCLFSLEGDLPLPTAGP